MLLIIFRILAIFLMIGAGWLARKNRLIDRATTRSLSRLLTGFFYPALVLTSMTRHYTLARLADNWHLPVGGWVVMVTGFAIGLALEPLLVKPRNRQSDAFVFQCTVNNFSFLPMPLALLFWGETAVAALIFSSLGAEVAMWTFGVYALSGRKLDRGSLRNLLNPPLLAIAAALLLITLREVVPEGWPQADYPAFGEVFRALVAAATMFGDATIPVAMIVAGSRMADLKPAHVFTHLQLVVVLVRLILVPVVIAGFVRGLPLPIETVRVLLLVSIMPSAVSSVILSEIYGADSEFAASSVLVTHVLCPITIPLWFYVLSF